MNIVKRLEVGDIIECRGIKVEIGKIISQDAFIPKKDVLLEPRIDIEFEDTNGKYRRWVSDLDGGCIYYASDKVVNQIKTGILAGFYEPQLGIFNIPISSINADISSEIIKLLNNSYGLSYTRGIYNFYTVFPLNDSCVRYRKILKCKKFVKNILQSKCYNYAEYISIDEYAENEELQSVIDDILSSSDSHKEELGGWSVILTINKGSFMLAEVLNGFA